MSENKQNSCVWVFFVVVVIAVRLRLAVRNGFDVALGAERSQTRLRVSRFTRKGFSLKRFFFFIFFFKLAIGKSDSGGWVFLGGLGFV